MANSYSKLANLKDEDEKPKKGFARLASLEDSPQESVSPDVAANRADGLPDDFPRHSENETTGEWWNKEASALLRPEAWKRQAKLAGRAAIEGVEGLPMMAMDMGVAGRNLLTGSNYQLPSEMNRESMNTFLPTPKSNSEKIASFVESTLAGSRMPAPEIKNGAPTDFISPDMSPASATLRAAQKEGYVVPPASASDSLAAKGIESLAGKLSTAQAASVKNQEITNELARKATGLASGQPITESALKGIRDTAGKVYEQISSSGNIVADEQYLNDLAQLGKGADEVAAAFPGANVGASKQIGELTDSLLQEKFDAGAAVKYLRQLRKDASANLSGVNFADPSKQALGMAQKEAAATLEDLIMRHLTRNGSEDLAKSFGAARKAIAVSYSVENALNESTGNVIATKLGQQMAKGKPLSGELEIAAKFARAFPKAAKEVTESMPGASPLDWTMGIMTSAASHNPLGMLVTGARPAARAAALSAPVQAALSSAAKPYVPPSTIGVGPSGVIQLNKLLNQGGE